MPSGEKVVRNFCFDGIACATEGVTAGSGKTASSTVTANSPLSKARGDTSAPEAVPPLSGMASSTLKAVEGSSAMSSNPQTLSEYRSRNYHRVAARVMVQRRLVGSGRKARVSLGGYVGPNSLNVSRCPMATAKGKARSELSGSHAKAKSLVNISRNEWYRGSLEASVQEFGFTCETEGEPEVEDSSPLEVLMAFGDVCGDCVWQGGGGDHDDPSGNQEMLPGVREHDEFACDVGTAEHSTAHTPALVKAEGGYQEL